MTKQEARIKTDEEMRKERFPQTWDNTMGTQGCPRKFYWFWRGIDYKVRPAYFTFGQAWQEGIEAWYVYQDLRFEARTQAMLTAIYDCWNNSGSIESGVNTIDNLTHLAMWYAVEYDRELWNPVLLGDKMELGFKFPLSGTDCVLAGALDGYIQWEGYGALILENKTTGTYLNDNYINGWDFSSQVTQYIWALNQILGDEEVFGCLMNMASKRITQKAKTAWSTHGMVPDGIFGRSLQKRDEFQLEKFEEQWRWVIREYQRYWDNWFWPMTKDHIQCVGGIGKSPCLYKPLCLQPQEPWEIEDPLSVSHDFAPRKNVWTPWDRGEKEKKNE